jgi:hypothetical protein
MIWLPGIYECLIKTQRVIFVFTGRHVRGLGKFDYLPVGSNQNKGMALPDHAYIERGDFLLSAFITLKFLESFLSSIAT